MYPCATHTDMQVSLSLPSRLPLPVRVSPPGASLITADPRVLRWEFSSPQSPLLVPGGVLALAAVFMVEVGVAEEVMAELAAHRVTAEVCLNGVTGRCGRERAAEGMRVQRGESLQFCRLSVFVRCSCCFWAQAAPFPARCSTRHVSRLRPRLQAGGRT